MLIIVSMLFNIKYRIKNMNLKREYPICDKCMQTLKKSTGK